MINTQKDISSIIEYTKYYFYYIIFEAV